MPLVWIALAAFGGWLWWKSAHKFPSINPTADALTLLNFAPYSVMQGKETYSYWMAPEGLTPAQVTGALQMADASIARKHIPLPGPSTVPVFADLWAVHGRYTQPTATITPASLLVEQGVPADTAKLDSARMLAGILYAKAFNPTTTGKLLLIPIAAKQV